MKSESSYFFKLDLEIICPCSYICRYFQIEIIPPPWKWKSSQVLSQQLLLEVAQNRIILDLEFSFIKEKKKKIQWLNKNLPWRTELLYFSNNLLFCCLLNELIKIQGILNSTPLPYLSVVFTMQFVSYLTWKRLCLIWFCLNSYYSLWMMRGF